MMTKQKKQTLVKSRTNRLAALVPVLVGVLEASKEAFPELRGLINGYTYFAGSVAISSLIIYFRTNSKEY